MMLIQLVEMYARWRVGTYFKTIQKDGALIGGEEHLLERIHQAIVYSKWSCAFLDLPSSECTCARKSTCFVSRII